ncbi:MAG: type III secretion protein, partial [Clostridia bacterium]|nr:type III secretion protein [Clostridia bacterium]
MTDVQNSTLIVFLLVVTRITGALLFNPFFGKKNIPAIAKIGLAITVAVGMVPTLENPELAINSIIMFVLVILKELSVGLIIGFIMQLVISMVLIAGEAIDMQLGLGMGKVYDPQSNSSAALTGTMYNLF